MDNLKTAVELFSNLERRTICVMTPVEFRFLARRYGEIPVAEAMRLEQNRQTFETLRRLKRGS